MLYLELRWVFLLSGELVSVHVEQKAQRRLGKEKFGVELIHLQFYLN